MPVTTQDPGALRSKVAKGRSSTLAANPIAAIQPSKSIVTSKNNSKTSITTKPKTT